MPCDWVLSTLSNTAGSGLSCILERLWNPVERQIIYLVRYGSNIGTFRERARDLEAKKTDVLRLVEDAEDRGEEIKAEVRNWQVQTIQYEMDVELLEEQIQKSEGRCHTWHLDWRKRHQLSRVATKKTVEIIEHIRLSNFESISFPARSADVRSIPTPEFVRLRSALKVIKSVMELLKDNSISINIIGVYGSGGIGKTTLMKQVMKQLGKEIPFDKVIFVRVTQTPDVKRVQDEIARFLNTELEGDVEVLRAAFLSERLKRQKRVLIILDDLWGKLDLAVVGIPYGEEHKGCKIILTSRFKEVCDEMESTNYVQVEELTDEDRLILFKKKAGLPEGTKAFDRAAEEVVRQCGKLPNAIVIIGTALRHKPVREWNEAIKRKKASTPINVEGIPEEVVLCVALGYDQLETVAKSCLQFSCLFPPYYSVSMEEFVIHGLVDRLFPQVGLLGEVGNRVHPVVLRLISSSLLLEGDRESCFRIHDDTRKVVKYIAAREGDHFIAEPGMKKGWPREDLQNCEKLSLMDGNVTALPDQPKCPRLTTLFLQNNPFADIPIAFFEHTREIKNLDLSSTNISSLAPSLPCLEKLRSLHLENTHLNDASLIREFGELEVLILKGSRILELPNGIGTVSNLKLLDLSNNLFLQVIPPNVISKLSQLEELYVGNSFGDWEVEETANGQNARFSEVASLTRLTVLYIHVSNTKVLSVDFDGPWTNLKRFRVCVNDDYWEIAPKRSMHLKNLSNSIASWVKLLLEKTEYLTLTRSSNLQDIGEIDVQGFTGLMCMHLRACSMQRIFHSNFYPTVQILEELHVEYCYSLKEVFCLEDIEGEQAGLKRLRELVLVGLPKVLTIWKGNHSVVYLKNLKLMKVKDCGKLRYLFSRTLAEGLGNLEDLSILKCDLMEEIVSVDEAEVEQGAAQERNVSSAPQPMFFPNLKKLLIGKCNKMKRVLSLTNAHNLKQLEELTVASCNHMERIITVSDEEKAAENKNVLPKLKILALEDLPELDSVYNGEIAALRWPSLEELKVWDCPKLMKLPLDTRSAPKLETFKAHSAWFEKLQWNEGYSKLRLQPLLNEK